MLTYSTPTLTTLVTPDGGGYMYARQQPNLRRSERARTPHCHGMALLVRPERCDEVQLLLPLVSLDLTGPYLDPICQPLGEIPLT